MKYFAKQCKAATSRAKFKKSSQNINLVHKTKVELYNHGKRNLKIFHCQFINFSRDLNADFSNHNLIESSKCLRWWYSYEDSFHCFLIVNIIINFLCLDTWINMTYQMILICTKWLWLSISLRKMLFFDQVHNTFEFIKTVKDLVYTISIINMYTLVSDIDGGNLKRPFFCPLFNPHSLIYLYVYFEKKYFLNYIQPYNRLKL